MSTSTVMLWKKLRRVLAWGLMVSPQILGFGLDGRGWNLASRAHVYLGDDSGLMAAKVMVDGC
ncbi:hypothetical protein D3C86_1891830 [compost metagenome]